MSCVVWTALKHDPSTSLILHDSMSICICIYIYMQKVSPSSAFSALYGAYCCWTTPRWWSTPIKRTGETALKHLNMSIVSQISNTDPNWGILQTQSPDESRMHFHGRWNSGTQPLRPKVSVQSCAHDSAQVPSTKTVRNTQQCCCWEICSVMLDPD